jgi:hypothetical protein
LRQLPTRPDGFVEVTDRILWAPRGHRWTWQGVRFLALGGAFSIDRQYRKLDSGRWGWFKEEVITPRAGEAGHSRRADRTQEANYRAPNERRLPKHISDCPGAQ